MARWVHGWPRTVRMRLRERGGQAPLVRKEGDHISKINTNPKINTVNGSD